MRRMIRMLGMGIAIWVGFACVETAGAQPRPAGLSSRIVHFAGVPYELAPSGDRIAVAFAGSLGPEERATVIARAPALAEAREVETLPSPEIYIYETARDDAGDLAASAADLARDAGVRYAVPVYRLGETEVIPTDRLFVQLRHGADPAAAHEIAARLGISVVERTPWREGNFVLSVAGNAALDAIAASEAALADPAVEFAHPDFVRRVPTFASMPDPLFPQQWNLENLVRQRPTWAIDGDLDAREGWAIQSGDNSVTIAILDEGVDMGHPDYQASLDAANAWDFCFNDNDPTPRSYDAHGTACAGIAAAISNNIGIAGVASGARIMPIRIAYHNQQGDRWWVTTDGWLAGGIAWAYQRGADVLSNSWGSGGPSDQIHAAIRDAAIHGRGGLGAIVVFAAGNNYDPSPAYPAIYPETICVAATTPCDSLKAPSDSSKAPWTCDGEWWWGSNHGPGTDVAAPGVLIPATDIRGADGYDPTDYVANFNGTSSATPQVAGLAALLIAKFPHWEGAEIRSRIEQTCDKVGGYAYDLTTGISDELGHGRINIYRALSGKPQVEWGPRPDHPSVYRDEGDATAPYPRAFHESAAFEWLGEEFSPEASSDDPDDPDGIGNRAGRDAFDDGVRFFPPYVPGQMGRIEVTVSVEDPNALRYRPGPDSLRVDVWFDWQSDGAWTQSHDWVIQNYRVNPLAWGGARQQTYTLQFMVPDASIGWHIQNAQAGRFLHVRARVTHNQTVTAANQPLRSGEVEDYAFVNFVEMFDAGKGHMQSVAQGCDPWDWVNGMAPWQPQPCPAPFMPDAPPNGYMTAAIYNPIYAGDANDGLRTPSFDLTEMTEAFLRFEHSAVEMITGRVAVYVDGTLDSVIATYVNIPTTPPACGLAFAETVDLSHYCGDGFDDVRVAFEVFHDEPCGIAFPSYQDWFVDNVAVWAQDRIAPSAVAVDATPTGAETADVAWDAPGDDGMLRRAQLYNIRLGPETIGASNWRHSIWLRRDMAALPVPQPPGARETVSVRRLTPGLHHFSVRTLDEVTNIAAIADGGQNHPPDQVVPGVQTVVEGDTVLFTVAATDPDHDPLMLYSIQRPSGSTYRDAGNGTAAFEWITGTSDVGQHEVVLAARDPNGAADRDTVSVRVLPRVAPDHADHDAGNWRATMTDQGILGFLDSTQGTGSGFVYPKSGGANHLYIGSLWAGRDPSYVANRDYDADPAKEWRVSADPPGSIQVGPNHYSDQDIRAIYSDEGATAPLGLRIVQESWAFSYHDLDDFVSVRTPVCNVAAQDLQGLYLGLFMDFDLRGDGLDDRGSTDPSREMIYLTDPSGIHVGVRRLRPGGAVPQTSNVTFIHNATFVYPNQYISDADKFAFLSAADGAHSVSNAPSASDYGVLVAIGPFDLAAGESTEIAFAVVGGMSLAELQQNADQAQAVYAAAVAGADDEATARLTTRLLPNAPNPFRDATTIRFETARAGPVSVDIYDVSGRRVRSLVEGDHPAGSHAVVWDRRDDAERLAGSGVYFLRMRSSEGDDTRRIVLMR